MHKLAARIISPTRFSTSQSAGCHIYQRRRCICIISALTHQICQLGKPWGAAVVRKPKQITLGLTPRRTKLCHQGTPALPPRYTKLYHQGVPSSATKAPNSATKDHRTLPPRHQALPPRHTSRLHQATTVFLSSVIICKAGYNCQ